MGSLIAENISPVGHRIRREHVLAAQEESKWPCFEPLVGTMWQDSVSILQKLRVIPKQLLARKQGLESGNHKEMNYSNNQGAWKRP